MRAEVAFSFTLKAATCRPVRRTPGQGRAGSFMQNFLTKNCKNSTNRTGDLKAICQQQTEWRWRLLLPWLPGSRAVEHPGSLVSGVLVIGLGQWNYSNYLEKDFTVRCRQAMATTRTREEQEQEQEKTAKDGPDDCSSYRLASQQSNGFSTIFLSRNLIQSPNMKLPCGTLRNSTRNRQLTADRLLGPGRSSLLVSAFTYSCCSYCSYSALLLFLLSLPFLLLLLLLLTTIVNPIYYKCFLPLGVEHWHLANGKNVTKMQTNKQLPWQQQPQTQQPARTQKLRFNAETLLCSIYYFIYKHFAISLQLIPNIIEYSADNFDPFSHMCLSFSTRLGK